MLSTLWVLHILFNLRNFYLLTSYKYSSQLYWINPQAVIWKHKTGTKTNSQQGNNFPFLLTSCKCQLAFPKLLFGEKKVYTVKTHCLWAPKCVVRSWALKHGVLSALLGFLAPHLWNKWFWQFCLHPENPVVQKRSKYFPDHMENLPNK